MKGIFVAVVGPSGAGKDSVMREVQRLSPNVTIARRVITRQVSDVTEESEGVDQQEFLRRANSGAFALSWQAHGLSYAIPATVSNDLARGRHVLA
ncbi:MAG: phosphonate metabolism protein/1,5-bisphosphokinase (PRPP-forming) PhnN, partial [Pseudomonadota bacterium]